MKTIKTVIDKSKWDYINENLYKFPLEKIRGKIEVKNFGKSITSEEVLKWFEDNNCVPANATELFDWWNREAENFVKNSGKSYGGIVALGSIKTFGGHRRVPGSWWDGAKRDAYLSWFGTEFHDDYWFAFSRKSSELETKNSSESLNLDSAIKLLKKEGYRIFKEIT